MDRLTHAWCFSHGRMHTFDADETPWCTASWVAFAVTGELQALEAKQAAYGGARFLNELPVEKQLEVMEIGEARR